MRKQSTRQNRIFKELEKFTRLEYPTFIKNILISAGYDCGPAISIIDEETIGKLEREVDRNLLKNTIYENEEPFKFRIGHRALILNLPSVIEKLSCEKKKKKEIKIDNELDRDKLHDLLLNKLKKYFISKKINTDITADNIGEINLSENRINCSIKCTICDKRTRCIYDGYWRISNYTNHIVCDHKSSAESVPSSIQPRFQRANPNVLNELNQIR